MHKSTCIAQQIFTSTQEPQPRYSWNHYPDKDTEHYCCSRKFTCGTIPSYSSSKVFTFLSSVDRAMYKWLFKIFFFFLPCSLPVREGNANVFIFKYWID